MSMIPRAHHPPSGAATVTDAVVLREIARAQRIIEGQNFEIRRTLWRYSSMVEAQRLLLSARRQELLRDEAEPEACETDAPEHYVELKRIVGAEALRSVENRLTLLLLDRRWSNHLALVEDLREGIHLQRYAGRDPLTEFQRQLIEAYAAMMEGLREEVVETFLRLTAEAGRIDVERAGLRAPTSTWTYLINDNPFSSFGLSLIAMGNAGVSYATAYLAALYLPVTLAASVAALVRRWVMRGRREEARGGGVNSGESRD
jgi:preprotein translocase subunit SecA